MSVNAYMKLDLRFTARPLEELWCDTVIAFVFQGALCNGNGVLGLDVKTSGALTALKKKGFWTGVEGETLLVPSQNMIKAEKILLKGLGVHSRYSKDLLIEKVKEVGSALDRIEVNDIGIRIPFKEGAEPEYPSYVETTCSHLVDFFLSQHEKEAGFLLKLVVSLDDAVFANLEPAVRQLKQHFKSKLDYTIIIDRTDLDS